MSTTIENQIVKMQFDNKGFEQGAQQSMSTLDKLKKMLHFDKVDMTPLQQAFSETENTATKAGFHIRDVWLKVASTLENQIADAIVNTGKKIFNALSLEGVTDGFKEYELKMGSIQTIMAGTGESLATVNKYLDDLNTYSDKTIYSFSDMTNNIGKFTNAGVKLKDAVSAIKGIANEAAVSGANANEASRAMYNFAQALSAGFVKLIDWKSIENANMATKEFKQTLLDVAVGLGTVTKAGEDYKTTTTNAQGKVSDFFNATKGFNDSLNHQWMTTEVLTNALEIYATDIRELSDTELANYEKHLKEDLKLSDEQVKAFEKLGIKSADAATEIKTFTMLIDTLKEAIGSGWAMTWQYFIGDFEQAKALWTEVGNVLGGTIDKMSAARNTLVKAAMQTGWEKFTTMEKKAIPESEKFREVLLDIAESQGVLTHKQALEITSTEKLMQSFHELRWASGPLLKKAISEYSATLASMSKEELDAAGITEDMISQFSDFKSSMISMTKDGNDPFAEMANSMNNLGGRENIIQGLKNIFASLRDTLTPIAEAFDKVFGVMDPKKIFNLTQRFREFTEQMKVSDDAANTIRTSFTLAFGGIKTILNTVGTAINGVLKLILPVFNLFDAIFGLIGKVVAALTGSNGALDAADKFTKIGDSIGSKYLGLMQKLADFINKVADAIRGIPEATVFVKIRKGVDSAIKSFKRFWKTFVELPVIQQMIEDFNKSIENIQKKLEPVVRYVEKAFNSMKMSISKFFTWETLNTNLTKLYNGVKKIIDVVKGFGDRVKQFFTNLKSGKSVIESFRESFGDIIDKIKELKNNLFDFFDELFSKGDGITSKFDLEGIQQSIHNFVANITPDQITMIAVAASFMLIALNLLKLSNAMRNAVEAFTGVGTALKNVINSYIKKQKSAILQVAEAIVIVAAAFWVLSTIPTAKMENAKKAIITITACLGALTLALMGVGLALGKGDTMALVKLSSGLAIVAGSLIVAVAALKMLEYVTLDMAVIGKIAMVGIVLAMMITMTYLLTKLDKFNKGSLMLVTVAGSLFLAASALAMIGNIPQDRLDGALKTIGTLMIGLGLLSYGVGKLGVFSAIGLIAIVMTFNKLIPMLEEMVSYDYSKINAGLAQNELMIKKLGGLLLIMTAIGAIAGNRIKGAGIAFLAMSATFAILVGVAKLASMLKPSELAQGEQFIFTMAVIMALLEACSRKSKLGMFGGKDSEGSKAFIRIAETMAILLGIAKLASMMDAKDLIKGELAVLGLTALVGALVWTAKFAQKSEGVIGAVAKMLFAISLILGMIAVLAIIPMDHMGTAIATVIGIMTALGFLAFAVSKNSTVYDKETQKSTKGVAALVAAAGVIVVCGLLINTLAKQAPKNVATAALSLAGVAIAVAGLAKIIGSIAPQMAKINLNQVASLVGAGIMIWLISEVLGGITSQMASNNINPNAMLSAGAAIAAVLLGLTPVMYMISNMEDQKVTKGSIVRLVESLAALAVVAGALTVMSKFGGDPKAMIASAIALSMVLVAICAPIAVLGAVGSFINQGGANGMDKVVKGAVIALAAAAVAIFALSKWGGEPTSLMNAAKALSMVLIAICVPIAVLAAVGELCRTANQGTMVAAMGSALGALLGVAVILGGFASLVDIDRLVQLNDAIPVLVTVMGGVALLAVALGFAGSMAAIVPGSIGAAFGIMAAALVGFAAVVAEIIALGVVLDKYDWASNGLNKGLDAIILIFSKIGAAVGAAIRSFGIAATGGLDGIGKNLNAFAEQLVPFSENMSKVSTEAVNGCKNIAEAMLFLTAANFLEAIGKIFGFGKTDFTFFSSLGDAVSAFADSVKDVSPDAITKASLCSEIAKKLIEVNSSLDAKGGLAGAIFGEKDLKGFGKAIKTFGEGIKEFVESVSGLDESAISTAQNAADAAGPIITMTKSLVAHGGWLQKIMGEQDLKEFGTSITAFAGALTVFVAQLKILENVSPEYPSMIKRCAEATTPLVDLAAGLENSGGRLADWVGDNTLSRFGDTLTPFVKSLYAFALVLKKMDEDVPNYKQLIIDTADAVTHLSDLANGMDNMKGAKSLFEGDNRLDYFGKTLADFAKGLKSLTDVFKDVDTSMIPSIVDTTNKLIAVAIDASAVPKDAMKGLKQALSDLAFMPIYTIHTNWKAGQTTLTELLKNILDACKNIAVNRKVQDAPYYKEFGVMVPTSIVGGITEHKEELTGEAGALVMLVEAIKNYLDQHMNVKAFEEYGANVAIGLKNGIEAHTEEVATAAKNMANAVNTVVPKQLQEKSPSRLSYKFGKNYDLGLANGITDYTSTVVGSATDMSQSIVQTASNIISSIASVIESDMDTQPTIRPVLDTSGIEKGVQGVNKMFNNSDLSLMYRANSGVNKINAEKTSASNTSTGDGRQVAAQQVNFTQNNYSPKALSPIEIYRQTKNQISMLKGVTTYYA